MPVAPGKGYICSSVYAPNKGTWKGATGFSYGTVPIDTNMLFNMGSITKTFIAAEILKLAEEGLLGLDDSIKDYLPPHNFIDSTITIRQMLHHTSGLGEITNATWQNSINTDPYRWWEAQDVIDSFLRAAQALPNHVWAYCNTNYTLLGLIIEHIRQDSLTHVLRTDLINPFALNETYMHLREQFSNTIPHNWSNPSMTPGNGVDAFGVPQVAASTSTSAAGGLYTSAGDLAHWGYKLYSGAVISPASVQQMTTFTSVNGGYFSGYGLGCMRMPYNSKIYYGHAGNFFGMAASLYYYPQDGTTVALLVNEDCISPYIARELFASLMNTLLDVKDKELALHHVSLYPNPASSIVSVVVNASSDMDGIVNVYSVTGKNCLSRQVKLKSGENILQLALEGLSNGLYFYELQSKDGNRTEKLLIQR